jgi:hypothetical protein
MPRPRYHAAVSLALAALVVARTRRLSSALPVLIAGVLVDVDHFVDLAANRASGKPDWLIIPLHAWEWVLTLAARGSQRSLGLAGGLAAHLAMDQWNPSIAHPLAYWITFRLRHGFRARAPLVDEARFLRAAAWMRAHPTRWF